MKYLKTVTSFYNLPQEVVEDISAYRVELERFLTGELSADRFKPARVTRGVYSQRGQTKFMMRIKLPAGGLVPRQMELIAELSDKYGNGVPHVTTRQDIQLHWVAIEDTVKVMEALGREGLTTKGGGGNTIRNITACSDSGVCVREAFDTAPYAIALTEYFLTHPKALTLPRKYKIAFSGCSDDCALATVNDVGFIAATKSVDGKVVRGFRVYAAGGMGAWSKVASPLEGFLPAGDALLVAEAVLNVFDKYGNRRNKHKARLRFLVEKIGFDEFKRLYTEEFKKLRKKGLPQLDLRPVPIIRERPDRTDRAPVGEVSVDRPEGFKDWFDMNVTAQSQRGYYYAKIKFPLGDIASDKFIQLARVISDLGEGSVRTTHDQNIIMRWLTTEELARLYSGLKETGLLEAVEDKAGGVDDIMSCPGAATCNLGICLSKNLATELSRELKESGLPLRDLTGVDIKISGCPNSCAQHPVGAIGFFGAARAKEGRTSPHYNVLVGGRVREGETRLSTECGFVPARSVPGVVKEFLGVYLEKREPGEEFHAYLDRRGFQDMKTIAEVRGDFPTYDEDRAFYSDFGASEDFSLAGLGPGECGVGVFDMIETDMEDAKKRIEAAREGIDSGSGNPSEDLFKALVFASRSLLITRGVEPTTEPGALEDFQTHFVETGFIDKKFKAVAMRAELFRSGHLNAEGLKDGLAFAEELLAEVVRLYDSMDDALNFTLPEAPEAPEADDEGAPPGTDRSPDTGDAVPSAAEGDIFMDLRGVKCPINYVKAKIKIETMDKGQTLFMFLDEGEPVKNVPSSLKNDGQEVLKLEKTGEYYELLVRKAV